MEMCRVCLATEIQMVQLDETFVINYNLLTNLNITLLDGMPQYTCETCLNTVKSFIEFREKSITAETTLREIIYQSVKEENKSHIIEISKNPSIYDSNILLNIKPEIKEENDDDTLDSFVVGFDKYEEDIHDLFVEKNKEDVKLKRKKKKHKKHGIKTKLIGNTSTAPDLDKRWFCGICSMKFEEVSDLNKHLDTHTNESQCHLCQERMNSLSQLLAHRLVHIPLNQSRCHKCDKKFKSCIHLEHHYRNMHIEGDERKLSCNLCLTKCDTPRKLHNHRRQVHSTKKFFCDLCSKGFPCKTNLTSHIRSHSNNKTYICDMCGFSCKHSSGLKDHKIRKHIPQKVYCKQCKRPFQNQMAHDKHKCKTKLLICPICGVQLEGNARLSRHMWVHSNVKKYECSRCPAKYKTKGALRVHLDRHDGIRTKQCEFCPAKFYSDSVLIKHRRTHTGEKPYVCKVCNKGFTGNHNLKVHMKVHGEYLIIKRDIEQEDLSNLTK